MIWKPRVTVAVVAERHQRFLMVEENIRGTVRFNQPAGHLEDDESLIDAAVRECLEETAWQFQPEALVGIYRWRNTAKNDTFLRATFCGTCTNEDTQRPLDTGILATHWLTLEEIRSRSDLLRSPMVIKSIEHYLEGKRYPLELLTDLPGDSIL
ncbi:MAG: NUDIX hydrolase [Gammaproteobacteria bacterium]|nr:MAG: NUDIX hydrolase [Gammaproteobacteria bacterium]